VLADQQLQARRRRRVALAGVARTASKPTLAQGRPGAPPRGSVANENG